MAEAQAALEAFVVEFNFVVEYNTDRPYQQWLDMDFPGDRVRPRPVDEFGHACRHRWAANARILSSSGSRRR